MVLHGKMPRVTCRHFRDIVHNTNPSYRISIKPYHFFQLVKFLLTIFLRSKSALSLQYEFPAIPTRGVFPYIHRDIISYSLLFEYFARHHFCTSEIPRERVKIENPSGSLAIEKI